jgi:hypothetical protein
VTPAIANAPCTTPALGERLREVAEVAAVTGFIASAPRPTGPPSSSSIVVASSTTAGQGGAGASQNEHGRNAPSPPP